MLDFGLAFFIVLAIIVALRVYDICRLSASSGRATLGTVGRLGLEYVLACVALVDFVV